MEKMERNMKKAKMDKTKGRSETQKPGNWAISAMKVCVNYGRKENE